MIINFEINNDGNTYRDCLTLPEGNDLSADAIAEMQTRYQNWVDFVSAQSLIETPVEQADPAVE